MRTKSGCLINGAQQGVTLIETIVFIVIISIALGAVLMVFNQNVINSVDPAIRIKALERGQALMDTILTRKFDEHTPTGGIPACDSSAGVSCLGVAPDGEFDDVGDFNGYSDLADALYPVSVTVVSAGSEISLPNAQAKKITLTVSMPDGNNLTLAAYKINY